MAKAVVAAVLTRMCAGCLTLGGSDRRKAHRGPERGFHDLHVRRIIDGQRHTLVTIFAAPMLEAPT
jgi:hypothetical protein